MPLLDPKFYRFNFAENGDLTSIPDDSQPSGFVSYEEGWTNDYQLEVGVDPQAKPIDRQKHNQIFKDLCTNIKQYTLFGYPEWVPAAKNGGVAVDYDAGATVRYTNLRVYRARVDTNTEPTTSSDWEEVSLFNLTDYGLVGLEISNAGADPINDITVQPGQCKNSSNLVEMVLPATITKQIDAPWIEGDNGGGYAAASPLALDTWYRFFLISKADGTVDAGFDDSATAVNLLAAAAGDGYVNYRRIGWIYYESPGQIRLFWQFGNRIIWDLPLRDILTTTSTVATNHTLTAPPDDTVQAELQVTWQDVIDVGVVTGLVLPVKATDNAPSVTNRNIILLDASGVNEGSTFRYFIELNNASQIRSRFSANNQSIAFITLGWIDKRGQR